MKTAIKCAAFIVLVASSFYAGFRYALREEMVDAIYARGYLLWEAPNDLQMAHYLNQSVERKSDMEIRVGAEDVIEESIVNSARAFEILDRTKDVPGIPVRMPHESIHKVFARACDQAVRSNVTSFPKDAKVPDDYGHHPFKPPGFEIGKYFETILEPARLRAQQKKEEAKSTGTVK